MRKLISFVLLLIPALTFAQPQEITNFLVKENLLKNEKLAVIACDSAERPLEGVNGVFKFSLNGIDQQLKFNDGIAIIPQKIEKSTFLYIRHANENSTKGKLIYVLKRENNLNPMTISWYVLVLIPLIIIGITALFRKFLVIAVILFIVIFIFNSNNGLKIPTFFDTVFDGLKSIF